MLWSKPYISLVDHIWWLLQEARKKAVTHINQTIVITYRTIGQYIVEYEQGWADRAKYGSGLLQKLSRDLTKKFGKGFSYRNLRSMKQFYLEYNNWQSLPAKFKIQSWTHLVRLMHLKDRNERWFYMIECVKQWWTSRELDRQINSALYHRLLLSRDKDKMISLSDQGHAIEQPTDILKDPYILEFLWLPEHHMYTEKDFETAIINNLQMFLLELGTWFSFVARQKRIVAERENFFIDLVFYNRLLRCFLLIDLKIWKLTHQDIGQMQMYINRYDREVKLPEENKTIWLILCKENNDVIIQYTIWEDQKNQIFSKEYQLYLPKKDALKKLLKGSDG